ncbi:MAG TPA: diguanylate cyclase [Planctomycetota bacterium]|nr:diguanylate cyclase [Planctomycetota bacterium]
MSMDGGALADELPEREESRTAPRPHPQADELRTELLALQRNLAEMRADVNGDRALQILEVNEQLVLAALKAEAIADRAVSRLGELTRTSQRDALTGTPNRAVMMDRLTQALALARRNGTCLGVIFIDLDRFKEINDTLGHAVGDQVLQMAARRMEKVLRDSDTVSRQGGDEFVLLLGELAHPSDAELVAAKVHAALSEPLRIGAHELHVSASLGLALFPDDGEDTATLISRADAAMYRIKRGGQGGYGFHGGVSPEDRPADSDWDRRQLQATRASSAARARESSLTELREANSNLVVAALAAQEAAQVAQAFEAQAREAQRQQVRFMAIVAHELRNPLAPIRTAVELLDRARADQPLLHRLQALIERQVTHMSRLVDDLLDASRISTGKLRLQVGMVELSAIVDMAVQTCRAPIERMQQYLELDLPPHPVRLPGDPVRLTQVVINLLDNACKYTPSGGRIWITAAVRERSLVLNVSDNGIGITKETIPNIFDLFVQDSHAATMHAGGLGIGLAVARGLVEAHGGSIAASSPGRNGGSRFVVTLPMSGKRAAAHATD